MSTIIAALIVLESFIISPRFQRTPPDSDGIVVDGAFEIRGGGLAGEPPRNAPPPRCKEVAVGCRAKCLSKLNRKDPFPFYRCINECLEAAGCPPGMY